MALAIRFDEMLRTGEVSDTIELARRGHVTQPRMSQIMALNQLAPDIQEALLTLPATKGKPEITRRRLRPIAAMLHWEDQRAEWRKLISLASIGAQKSCPERSEPGKLIIMACGALPAKCSQLSPW